MKNKKIVFIIVILTVIPFYLQFVLFKSSYVVNKVLQSHTKHSIQINNIPIEIVCLGSSQAAHGIKPQILSEMNNTPLEAIVNLGANAETPSFTWAKYLSNEESIKDAKIVYMTFDPWSYSKMYATYASYNRYKLTYSEWNILNERKNITNNFYYPYRTLWRFIKSNEKFNLNARGYSGLKAAKKLKPYNYNNRATFTYNFPKYKIDLEEIMAVKSIKERVEHNGGKFILVMPPKHHYWVEFYLSTLSDYHHDLLHIFDELIGPVSMIGTFSSREYNLTDNLFKDPVHISEKGSELFTKSEFMSKRNISLKEISIIDYNIFNKAK